MEAEECDDGQDVDMTIGELMEYRYLKAEREKEEVNSLSEVVNSN
jgi:RNA polymerase II-associated protein 3